MLRRGRGPIQCRVAGRKTPEAFDDVAMPDGEWEVWAAKTGKFLDAQMLQGKILCMHQRHVQESKLLVRVPRLPPPIDRQQRQFDREIIGFIGTGGVTEDIPRKLIEKDDRREQLIRSVAPRRCTRRMDSCLLYTSPSPRDRQKSRMPSSA